MKRTLALLLLTLLLSSHELFLKIDSHFLKPDSKAELYLYNGTFDESENVITRDRIVNDKVIGPKFMLNPKKKDYYDKHNVTYLKFETGDAGTYVAGVSTLPNMIELTAREFKEYLEHEGLTDVLADREKTGKSNRPAKEKYSKHVKNILQVGDRLTEHYNIELGYPIEFIPLENPYAKKVGDDISFKLLRSGNPVADQVVHYSFRSDSNKTSGAESSIRTNKDGIITIPISKAGKWYIATIHMVESSENGVDYESNWATLTFEIKE
ncbi:MAG: DUF4198 domain-containing protein [Bacteroidota bacterium]